MRIPRKLMALSATLLFASAGAALAQSPVKVEVTTAASHTVWYTDPVWLGLGALVLVLLIVLAIAVSRSGKSTTTVVR
jgi:hypothetical protein